MVINSNIALKLYNLWSTGPEIMHNDTFRPYTRARAYKVDSSNQN